MKFGSRTRRGVRHEGFVLVTVLFITTMLLSAAASFALFARQEMRRTSDEEFALVARSLANVACGSLSDWIASDTNDFDSELELLYRPGLPIILNFGDWDVTAKISPQDRLVPINGLFLPDGITLKTEYEYAWSEFWRLMGNDRLGEQMLDFLDKDVTARPGSNEQEYFVNRKISDLSELFRFDDIDFDMVYSSRATTDMTFDKFFTVYGDGMINVNLAPIEVLAALDPQINTQTAEAIIAYRSENKISSEKDLLMIPGFPMSAQARLANVLAYKSRFFLVDMKVTHAGRERNFSVMLEKGDGGCHIKSWRE